MKTIEPLATPWHRESFLRFVNDYLPALLDERLPLGGYHAVPTEGNWEIRITLDRSAGGVQITSRIPDCSADGVFIVSGKPRIVVPVATAARLDEGEILCVGEQLHAYLKAQIPQNPAGLDWDEALLTQWIALESRVLGFVGGQVGGEMTQLFGWKTAQVLDEQNCLARMTHLRRIIVPKRHRTSATGSSTIIDSSELNRVCPFETPEGPAVGRVLSIARGAAIRDRKLVIVDSSHAGKLGVNAATIPCFNHTDANRLLMGVNIQRQWVPLPNPEPSFVQTGLEPVAPEFWCGRNLLTAYMALGACTFEDAIVLSESAARRLSPEQPVEVGDKLANRHGQKGVISLILPDEWMPHTPEGKPADIIFSFLGLQSRMSFGQLREGLLGLLAAREGQTVIVPPFGGPDDDELERRLQAVGLPKDGMQQLSDGRDGPTFERTTFVGLVYWGLTVHRARAAINLRPQTASHVQYLVLRELRAYSTILDLYHTQSTDNPDSATLPQRLKEGLVSLSAPPAPRFTGLQRQLAKAGVDLRIEDGVARCRLRPPGAQDLPLAVPVPHPWLPGEMIETVAPELAGELADANAALHQLLQSHAPARLIDRSSAALKARVEELFARILPHDALRMQAKSLFAARAVIAPTDDLTQHQCGLPDAIAWKLFGAMVAGEVGEDAVAGRTAEAAAALDRIMAHHWVLLVREPAVMPTTIIAFRPMRRQENVIRLHPLCCAMMNADHDGDQLIVYLPVTAEGQKEAGEKLSCVAHLQRDPATIRWMVPRLDALFGLAWLSRTDSGRLEIAAIAGSDAAAGQSFLTLASLRDALAAHLHAHGADRTLDAIHRLMLLGQSVIRRSGCSFNPFAHRVMPRLASAEAVRPQHPQPEIEAAIDQVISRTDYDTHPAGPQLFAIKSGARGNTMQVAFGMIGRTIIDYDSKLHYFTTGALGGLSPEACFMSYIGARMGIAACGINVTSSMRQAYGVAEPAAPQGFGVFARAMRSEEPGPVFARAAAAGETDPLADPDSRLLVGLG